LLKTLAKAYERLLSQEAWRERFLKLFVVRSPNIRENSLGTRFTFRMYTYRSRSIEIRVQLTMNFSH
jgi:hypothetical protein